MPKYLIRKSRYIDGEYVRASPEAPAIVDLPEGTKVDKGLLPLDTKPQERLKPHFVEKASHHAQPAPDAKSKGKRPSDADPI